MRGSSDFFGGYRGWNRAPNSPRPRQYTAVDYDTASGPHNLGRRRPTDEWFDPYAEIDHQLSVVQVGNRATREEARFRDKPKKRSAPTPRRLLPQPDFKLTFPEPATNRWPSLISVPYMAELRRGGRSCQTIGILVDKISADTVRWLMEEAGYDDWGWRPDMAHRCESCGGTYSPWHVRRSYRSSWPGRFCRRQCFMGARTSPWEDAP